MKKFLFVVLGLMCFTTLALASVETQKDGVKINNSEAINLQYGPAISGNGTVTDIDFRKLTGPISIGTTANGAALQVGTGTSNHAAITTTNDAYVTGDLEVDGVTYLDGLIIDPAIYTATAGVGGSKQLWISLDGKIYAN